MVITAAARRAAVADAAAAVFSFLLAARADFSSAICLAVFAVFTAFAPNFAPPISDLAMSPPPAASVAVAATKTAVAELHRAAREKVPPPPFSPGMRIAREAHPCVATTPEEDSVASRLRGILLYVTRQQSTMPRGGAGRKPATLNCKTSRASAVSRRSFMTLILPSAHVTYMSVRESVVGVGDEEALQ